MTIQKLDPILMLTLVHEPVSAWRGFVTDDGAETDLDLGHYEDIDSNLTQNNNVTTGKIYWSVINKERSGEYLEEPCRLSLI